MRLTVQVIPSILEAPTCTDVMIHEVPVHFRHIYTSICVAGTVDESSLGRHPKVLCPLLDALTVCREAMSIFIA